MSAGFAAGPPEKVDVRLAAAYDAGQQRLSGQFGAIDELRGRVGTLLSAAFLLVVDCAIILWPRTWSGDHLNPVTMIESAGADPNQTVDDFHRTMAGFAAGNADNNAPRIARMYHLFSVGLVLLCLDFAGWIWALANR